MYLWDKPDCPSFSCKLLVRISREQGRLPGKMEVSGFELRNEAHLRTLTEDMVK